MYAFLLAAAFLVIGILSYTFLLTDLDPIESKESILLEEKELTLEK